jgi:formylglycine-generating enzyme required for sulfatase activity
METNPSQFRGEKRPVDSVTLYEAEQFIHRLNLRNDGYIYRLPTEAEWEYAARAGSLGEYTGKLDAVAWYKSNSGGSSHEVAQKEPNAYGLFDVHGNVWEWCADRYKESYYSESPSSDPKGPSDGLDRVLRGGSWFYAERFQRLSVRWKLPPSVRNANVGFRVLRQEPD